MNVFVLEWDHSDGYDNCNACIGVYATRKGAELAYQGWLVSTGVDLDIKHGYEMQITEHELGD